jgi:biopolymer transport protein TolQ
MDNWKRWLGASALAVAGAGMSLSAFAQQATAPVAEVLPPEAADAAAAAAPAVVGQDLNLWVLILHASIPVQLVMLLLVLASVASWMIIFRKKAVLDAARKGADVFEERFWSGADLSALFRDATQKDRNIQGLEAIFEAGFREFARLRQKRGLDTRTQLEGAQRAMRAQLAREVDELEHNLEFLANVGSISPYVGLFGTVWGIMISFQGLANVKEATIATVAPGISEALIATAMGLFAAIPAVWAYNRYATKVDRMNVRYEAFAEEFSSILQRQSHAEEH